MTAARIQLEGKKKWALWLMFTPKALMWTSTSVEHNQLNKTIWRRLGKCLVMPKKKLDRYSTRSTFLMTSSASLMRRKWIMTRMKIYATFSTNVPWVHMAKRRNQKNRKICMFQRQSSIKRRGKRRNYLAAPPLRNPTNPSASTTHHTSISRVSSLTWPSSNNFVYPSANSSETTIAGNKSSLMRSPRPATGTWLSFWEPTG